MPLYTVPQVAEILNVRELHVRNLIGAGELLAVDVSVGSAPRYRITQAELDRFITSRSTQVQHV